MQTTSADQDRDERRAGPVVAAGTGLLLLACCALPLLLCCGLPLIAAGTLQEVSPDEETSVTFSDDFLDENPQFAGFELRDDY